MTPLGRPVEPEVYMMNARSSAFGKHLLISASLAFPAAMRASNVVVVASPILGKALASSDVGKAFVSPPTVLAGTKHFPIKTMCWRLRHFERTGPLSTEYWAQSTNNIVASVSFKACNIASWPSVVYTVTMGNPHLKHACAAICHSADVSARIAATHSFFIRSSMAPGSPITPDAAPLTSSPTSENDFHTIGPLFQYCFLPSMVHSTMLRVPMQLLDPNFATELLKRFGMLPSMPASSMSGKRASWPSFLS
mmetsp:Transcript_89828/g.253330  ORF Transcript_89828/g.253330 Transcript_89828/m.253330 type:complete len:251 (-) Transcript_89828:221-973(-)